MKRLFASVLCIIMLFSLVPASASANGRIGLDAVASIGSDEYSSFEEAVNACGAADTIVLLDNVEYTMRSGDCFKVNKNGFTLNVTPYTAEVSEGVYHDLVHHDAQAPGCTDAGWDEYYACSYCTYSTKEEIQPVGHTMTHHEAKAAAPSEDGNTEYWSCSKCEKYFSDAEGNTEIEENSWVIPATGAVKNVTTGTNYSSLSVALAAAVSGDEIKLLDNISNETYIEVLEGVTLDLNGHNITGAMLFYVTGQVIDSASTRGYVTSSGWMFGPEQVYTPIYDAVNSGYQFIELSVSSNTKMSGNAVTFGLYKVNRADAYSLFSNNPNYCKSFKAYVTVSWSTTDGVDISQTYCFPDSFMKKVVDSASTSTILGFKATITGVTGNATLTPKFIAYDSTGTVLLHEINGPSFITTDSGVTWTKV